MKQGNLASSDSKPRLRKDWCLKLAPTLPDMEAQAIVTSLHFIAAELGVAVDLYQQRCTKNYWKKNIIWSTGQKCRYS